jgi:hypothetical protein
MQTKAVTMSDEKAEAVATYTARTAEKLRRQAARHASRIVLVEINCFSPRRSTALREAAVTVNSAPREIGRQTCSKHLSRSKAAADHGVIRHPFRRHLGSPRR